MNSKADRVVQNETSSRRIFLRTTALGAVGAAISPAVGRRGAAGAAPLPQSPGFEFDEVTVDRPSAFDLAGKLTSRALTENYLGRIAAMDKQGPAVNAIIELNPDALAIAEQLDKERKQKGSRGPLHGIPVLIKDNIDTATK